MKPKLLFCLAICTLFTFSCKSQTLISKFDNLTGTWKIEGKETYESWKKTNASSFKGTSYKLVNGEKKVTETLSIEENNDKVIYKATVPSQNQGQTIPFVLNTKNENLLSFENSEHDFPKKIQYKMITKDKLLVNVLGEDDKGFSYYLIRQ